VDVSSDASSYPIYAWYDDEGTIYYYSDADDIYLNSDSSYMFYRMVNVEEIDIKNLKNAKIKNMENMFSMCSKLTYLDLSNIDISSLENVSRIFF
jgi:surface protein